MLRYTIQKILYQRDMKCFSHLGAIISEICQPARTRKRFPHLGAYYTTASDKRMLEITKQNAEIFLDQYDTFLLDCDGVLWKTDHITPITGIGNTIQKLQYLGKHILYVTNNSMHCRNDYIKKFREHGFDSLKKNIFCVAHAAAVYLKKVKGVTSSVYLVGSYGMEEELNSAGIANFGAGKDPDDVYKFMNDLLQMKFKDNVQAVLVGYDKYFDLNKLYKASSYLSHSECLFVATNNLEKSVLIAPNRVQPVTGAIVDAVTSSAKRSPEIIGKPNSHLFECITAVYPFINVDRTVMIGDSLRADIAFAKAVGIDSVLTLSGASELADLSNFPGLEPTYFLKDLNILNHD